jgi:hypothetical protein
VCVHVGKQWSCGVVIERLRSIYSEPSSSTLTSLPIDLPLPLERLGTNLSSSGTRAQVAREVLSCAF